MKNTSSKNHFEVTIAAHERAGILSNQKFICFAGIDRNGNQKVGLVRFSHGLFFPLEKALAHHNEVPGI
jgi:hypothetical protein